MLQDRLGRYDAPLGCALLRLLEQLPFPDPGPQELPDEVEELAVSDTVMKELHQLAVMDRLEVGGDVSFNHPEELLALGGRVGDTPDRVHRAAVRAEPEGVLNKVRFQDGFEGHPNSFLNNPVAHGRHMPSALPLRPKRPWDA